MTKAADNITIYYIYDEADEHFVVEFEKHLIPLSQKYALKSTFSVNSPTGFQIEDVIINKLVEPAIVIPFLSANFYASETCTKEYKAVLENSSFQNIFVVPILAKNCYFEITDVAKYKVLPKNRVPIENWQSPSDAYTELIKTIEGLVLYIKENVPKTNKSATVSVEKEKYINMVLNDEFELLMTQLGKLLVGDDKLLASLKNILELQQNTESVKDTKSHTLQINRLRWNILKMVENLRI